jgi:hypothetical protein
VQDRVPVPARGPVGFFSVDQVRLSPQNQSDRATRDLLRQPTRRRAWLREASKVIDDARDCMPGAFVLAPFRVLRRVNRDA